MQNILFRADSSSTIGTGHIMRDLVLAEQFNNANIIFATQKLPGNINYKIKEKNYAIEILNSNKIDELIDIIKKHAIDMIIIDHYGIDHDYEKALKEITGVTIFVLDDTYEKHYCDILLNHNIYADSSRYKNLVPEHCELRCGVDFTLLRDEFRSEKTKQRKSTQETKNVFIAMGGADHTNRNIDILKVLKNFPNIHANVVTTAANQYLDKLKEYIANKDNITLHINTDQIAKLMSDADFAIVTPSVTVNEVVYMNIPFIAIKTADNQNEMYEYLLKSGYKVLESFNATKLKSKIKNLMVKQNIELINFIDLPLEDQTMVLQWRNSPAIRKWMFNQDKISLRNHLAYIVALKTKTDRSYFLVKRGTQAIGVIDFTNIDRNNSTTEFGIYANPSLRTVGDILMEAIIDYAFDVLQVKTLISEVFTKNNSATKLYKRYNFKEVTRKSTSDANIITMELKNENR